MLFKDGSWMNWNVVAEFRPTGSFVVVDNVKCTAAQGFLLLMNGGKLLLSAEEEAAVKTYLESTATIRE